MPYIALPTARRFINRRLVEAVTIFLALVVLSLLMCRKVTFITVLDLLLARELVPVGLGAERAHRVIPRFGQVISSPSFRSYTKIHLVISAVNEM